jgi:hypothetical protein
MDKDEPRTGKRIRSRAVAVLILAAMMGAGVAAAFGSSGGAEPPASAPPPPPVYGSEQERLAAELSAGKAAADAQHAQRTDLRASINSGALRIDALPSVELSLTDIGPGSLSDAIATATEGVVRGRVVGQVLVEGFILSTVSVDKALRGDPEVQVQVAQVGGPILHDGQPAILQGSTDPLLRLNREYILFMGPCPDYGVGTVVGAACISGSGRQLEVEDARVINVVDHPHGWKADLEGIQASELEELIQMAP